MLSWRDFKSVTALRKKNPIGLVELNMRVGMIASISSIHLAINRAGANFSTVLQELELESLAISGRDAPLSNITFEKLRELVVNFPVPASYFDLLATLTTAAPAAERIVRTTAGDRAQLPGDVISQIRAHPTLKTFSDRMFFLSDDNALSQLIETKQTQFESLRVYSEDSLKLSQLCQLSNLRKVTIDGKNLEPAELESVFLIQTLERLSLSWTFKDDPSCVLESQCPFAQRMMDVRCNNLKSIYLHLDFLSVSGRAWGKNVIANVLQQCPRLRRVRNSDWLLGQDYAELRELEGFVDVVDKIDINVNSTFDLFSVLHVLTVEDDQSLAADPFRWRRLTSLSLFINEDYYICDLSCVNGATLPNLVTFKIGSDDEVFFERFCDVTTLPRLSRVEGVVRFENSDAELDWLDQIGEHRKVTWVSTIQTTLTPSLFCDILMRARARMSESGYTPPATVIYVSIAATRRIRPPEADREKWAEVAKILYTSKIMIRLIAGYAP